MKTAYKVPGSKKLAIVSMENLTPNIKAGQDMARFSYNQFFEKLYGDYKGRVGNTDIELIDEFKIDSIMQKNKWLDVTSHIDVGLKAFGEELNCDLLLMGTVSEYHYKRGLGEDPVVGVHLRLIDIKDETVIWSGSLSRVGKFSWFKEDALGRLGQQVAKDLVSNCLSDLNEQIIHYTHLKN